MAKWYVKNLKEDIAGISKETGIHPILVRLMLNRKIPEDKMNDFLKPTLENSSHDPFLMKDMDKALDLLIKHIDAGSSILIVGDYDQDGNSATMTLLDGLMLYTDNISYAIPNRLTDGYGISMSIIEKAKEGGAGLIITCDNGISAFEEIEKIKELGMDVIITDHHQVPEEGELQVVPQADAVLNPQQWDCNYPFKELCGAGVAFKFIQGLYTKLDGDMDYLSDLLEYVCMGTVCDIVDLVDENRYIVIEGLKKINSTENYGMKSLIKETGIKGDVSVYSLGFIMGPCINAAGRLDTASKGIELFYEENMEKVEEIAKELVSLNNERKDLTEIGYERVKESVLRLEKLPEILVLKDEEIHESIVGIIAGRIKEFFSRPTILFTKAQEEGVLKGSGRSIEQYNMFEEINPYRETLVSFGGHAMAAGMSISEDNFEEFSRVLNESSKLKEEDFQPKIYLDSSLNIEMLNFDLVDEIEKLSPFGKGNSRPLFGDKKILLKKLDVIGKNKNVLRFSLEKKGKLFTGISFRDTEETLDYLAEKFGPEGLEKIRLGLDHNYRIDICYYPQINEFNQKKTLQLHIKDLR
ncbi:MAG: single-stranded-DNA-specific exonuclease RecJ [Gallicola sp.]|uniref:single-stranded-DNA-specific exonuclease RecJ n=1 Tax=Gallicola sp. Sow4_E12 TaxID=3438785 RepID=UPI0017CA6F6E|nr:single-stranded-DNA-specific exonuclease RecJ [Gallicola sp.]